MPSAFQGKAKKNSSFHIGFRLLWSHFVVNSCNSLPTDAGSTLIETKGCTTPPMAADARATLLVKLQQPTTFTTRNPRGPEMRSRTMAEELAKQRCSSMNSVVCCSWAATASRSSGLHSTSVNHRDNGPRPSNKAGRRSAMHSRCCRRSACGILAKYSRDSMSKSREGIVRRRQMWSKRRKRSVKAHSVRWCSCTASAARFSECSSRVSLDTLSTPSMLYSQ
mmetsp:Transcript_111651/g.320761  ORF Transcript_111651/g.320761 Transcript_111651/m.320761 type:complete len:222 (-) Transcript_111651:280-945(-)